MVPTVRLTIANGKLEGKEYVFEQPFVGFIGRASDCEIPLPDEPEYLLVSRHHCLLNIQPPEIRVSDCGSVNGTFVNGVRINGPREYRNIEIPLQDGDNLRVGCTVLRVGAVAPAVCEKCGTVLGPFEIAYPEREAEDHLCAACREKPAEIAAMAGASAI
jgi:eukaryotic-like serine/threonine-protein kinase